MRLIADQVKRKAGLERCECCGKLLHTTDRVFFEPGSKVLWCSVRCAISVKKALEIVRS